MVMIYHGEKNGDDLPWYKINITLPSGNTKT